MRACQKLTLCFKKYPLCLIGFFQALGIMAYCGLVGLVFWRGNIWFGKMNNYLGPVLVLTLLSVSVLICALLAFGYPVLLFWDKKQIKQALTLVAATAGWLTLFVLLTMLTLVVF